MSHVFDNDITVTGTVYSDQVNPTNATTGSIALTAGTTSGDITFDSNGAAAAIPVNSSSDPDLNTTAQNLVGAINELAAVPSSDISFVTSDMNWNGISPVAITNITIGAGTWLLMARGSFNTTSGAGILWLSDVSSTSTTAIQGSQCITASINAVPMAIMCLYTAASTTTIYWVGATSSGTNTGIAIDVSIAGSAGPTLDNVPCLLGIRFGP